MRPVKAVEAPGPCPDRATLLDFRVGKLPAEQREAIAAHLDGCGRCLAVLEEQRDDLDSLLAQLRQPLPPGVVLGLAGPAPPAAESTDPGGAAAASPDFAPAAPSRYEPEGFHARGGLGEVLVARDRELGRKVALKRIRAERAHDPDSRRRFEREAEITGNLEHPGIVPVYGLVQGADGQPCYAMRFVQGESLREAIEGFHAADQPGRDPGERSLALRQLLGRFVAVCNTMAYAHSRGIVHRDLKPANVMLGKYGETLVVDWGLARPFDRTEAERSSGEESLAPTSGSGDGTRLGQAVGTPAYMSPEQAHGRWDEVGPASDLFSLGATLYSLLTGLAPYQGQSPQEVLAKARRLDFPPPRSVKHTVPAALEAICLRAMAAKPAERYATALDLKAEVEHWLADEPIRAYQEPWPARARRWVRRHRALTTGVAGAALAVLLLGGGGWLWLAGEWAEQQRGTERRMSTALGKAGQLRDQAAAMQVEEAGQAEAALAVWRQALAAAEQADQIRATGRAGEETTRRGVQLLAELRREVHRLGKDVRLLAALDEARMARSVQKGQSFDLAASAAGYRKAFAVYGLDVLRHKPGVIVRELRRRPDRLRRALAVALDDWAICVGKPEVVQRLREIADQADDDPWRRRLRRAVNLEALKQLAEEARHRPLPAASLDLLALSLWANGAQAEATTLLRRAQQRHPGDFWINFKLGYVLTTPGQLSRAGREEAIGYFRVAAGLRPDNAAARYHLGFALFGKGDVDGAIAECRQAIALDPRLALAHNNLGSALYRKGDVRGALACFRRALARDPRFALAHFNLGLGLQGQGDVQGARACYRRAIALDARLAEAHYSLGDVLQGQGDGKGAIACYRKAIALNPRLTLAHMNLGTALLGRGDLKRALASYRQALALVHINLRNAWKGGDGAIPGSHQALALAHVNIGIALLRKGDVDEALAAFRQALVLDPRFAQAHIGLGAALSRKGDVDGAIAACRQALVLDPRLAAAHGELGTILHGKGDVDGAIAEWRRAIALDPKFAGAHVNLGNALLGQGEVIGAMAEYRRALAIRPRYARAHCLLGVALREAGDLQASLASLRRGHELGIRLSSWRLPSAEWVKQAERLVQLEGQLPAFLRGDRKPRGGAERLELAEVCRHKQRFAAAVRFYREAFAEEPKWEALHRYSAARVAVLAGCGRGQDAAQLKPEQKADLRRQALSWLRAALDLAAPYLNQGTPQARHGVHQACRLWQRSPDLAGVRDAAGLARLPEAEREAWRKLWADVAQLVQRTGDSQSSPRIKK
jgi:tetratricopeptide (TPR) repeat protein/tRNA A-37 threonylcarbamoyl transferase component Bud32